MKKLTVVFGAILATAASSIPAGSSAQPAAHAAKTCKYDTPAVIKGKHECLGDGEYCSLRDQNEYKRYGYVCSTAYDPPRLRKR